MLVIWHAPGGQRLTAADVRIVWASSRGPFGFNFVLGVSFDEYLALGTFGERPHRIVLLGDASAYVQRVKSAGAIAVQSRGVGERHQIGGKRRFSISVAQGREAGGMSGAGSETWC